MEEILRKNQTTRIPTRLGNVVCSPVRTAFRQGHQKAGSETTTEDNTDWNKSQIAFILQDQLRLAPGLLRNNTIYTTGHWSVIPLIYLIIPLASPTFYWTLTYSDTPITLCLSYSLLLSSLWVCWYFPDIYGFTKLLGGVGRKNPTFFG